MHLWIGKPDPGNTSEVLFWSPGLGGHGSVLCHRRDGGFFRRTARSGANFTCDRCGAVCLLDVTDGVYLPAIIVLASIDRPIGSAPEGAVATEWGEAIAKCVADEGGARADRSLEAAGAVGGSVA